jgi:hypothetical protein
MSKSITVTQAEMRTMLSEAIKNFKALGYNVGAITDFKVSYRYSRAWAKCTRRLGNTYTITVSHRLFSANKKSVRDTIHHEVIHTIPGCFNHGPNFKAAAALCNKKFKTKIERCTTEAAMYYGKGSDKAYEYTKFLKTLTQPRRTRKAITALAF